MTRKESKSIFFLPKLIDINTKSMLLAFMISLPPPQKKKYFKIIFLLLSLSWDKLFKVINHMLRKKFFLSPLPPTLPSLHFLTFFFSFSKKKSSERMSKTFYLQFKNFCVSDTLKHSIVVLIENILAFYINYSSNISLSAYGDNPEVISTFSF